MHMTLMETKLYAYTNKFRVNQTNFNEKITNTVDSAINKALVEFMDIIKLETFHAESILMSIKKTMHEGKIPPKILT